VLKDKNEIAADLLRGKLVCLSAVSPEELSKLFINWAHSSEYWRLIANGPSFPLSQDGLRKFIEKDLMKDDLRNHFFIIHSLEDDRIIGEVGLEGISFSRGDSYVGIGIGERDYWGRGYGTDAMNVILRYAFTELNLQRVSLTVFEYNPRAIRSYEKCGFKAEGCSREAFQREGRRWDILHMGILRDEWEALNA
jgi:RimJ/RimL family protein N-acetyltransferase